MKKILVLGGTMFVGRSLVEKLLNIDGYDVTLFNRGKSNTGAFNNVKQIHGNRESDDINKILAHSWDVVVDFSGYYPNTFGKLLNNMSGKVGRYIFISTVSVYNFGNYGAATISEADAIHDCTEGQKTSKLPDAYGEKKAEMERLLLQQPFEKVILRPSFIYGKYDWTERFYYWLYRAKFSSRIIVPEGEEPYNFSISNANDLVHALLQSIAQHKPQQVYNAISQPVITLRSIVEQVANATGNKAEIISIKPEQMQGLKLSGSDFPLLVPGNFKVDDTTFKRDFVFDRSDMLDTFLEMLEYKSVQGYPKPPLGMSVEKEQEIIASLV